MPSLWLVFAARYRRTTPGANSMWTGGGGGRQEVVDGRRRWTSGGGGRQEAVDVRRRWTGGGGGRQEVVDGRRRWTSGGGGRQEAVDVRRRWTGDGGGSQEAADGRMWWTSGGVDVRWCRRQAVIDVRRCRRQKVETSGCCLDWRFDDATHYIRTATRCYNQQNRLFSWKLLLTEQKGSLHDSVIIVIIIILFKTENRKVLGRAAPVRMNASSLS